MAYPQSGIPMGYPPPAPGQPYYPSYQEDNQNYTHLPPPRMSVFDGRGSHHPGGSSIQYPTSSITMDYDDNGSVNFRNPEQSSEVKKGGCCSNVKIQAKGIWRFIKQNWLTIFFGAALIAVTSFLCPPLGLGLLVATALGITVGYLLSKIKKIGGGDRSLYDKLGALSKKIKLFIFIGAVLLFPLLPLVGSFLVGNHMHHRAKILGAR